jgi:hypothetical protein
MNHLIHAHDVTKRVTRIGEPISGTYKTLKGGSVDVEYTPSLPGGAGFIEATIYSKFDEHNNSIIVKYNGYCFYLEKTVIGFPIEYVVIPFTVVQYHKYVITVTVNPDWTCQLALDGVGALPGYGAELVVDGTFAASGWIAQAPNTISAGTLNFNASTANIGAYQNAAGFSLGLIYLMQHQTISISTGSTRFNITQEDDMAYMDTAAVGIYKRASFYDSRSDGYIRMSAGTTNGPLTTAVIDNCSIKQIHNSTTTQAPTYRGHLGG